MDDYENWERELGSPWCQSRKVIVEQRESHPHGFLTYVPNWCSPFVDDGDDALTMCRTASLVCFSESTHKRLTSSITAPKPVKKRTFPGHYQHDHVLPVQNDGKRRPTGPPRSAKARPLGNQLSQ